uniref:Uncharacterized protein n=1 Tax=Panagrolaimus sp. JU765 TaxID=591449 RepID=A0AC34RMZ3_9BILA
MIIFQFIIQKRQLSAETNSSTDPDQLASVNSIPHLSVSNLAVNELPTYQQAVFRAALARSENNHNSDWDSTKSLPPPDYSTFGHPDLSKAPPSYRE